MHPGSRRDGCGLEVVDLAVQYGRRRVVDGASFSVRPASVLAIVGPSGSGKSSILRSVAMLQRPRSGSVVVSGQRFSDMRGRHLARARRDRFGLVFQQDNLVEELTVRENIRLALDLRSLPDAEKNADDAVHRFGLATVANSRPSQISGGEAQRAAMARVFAQRPPVALLDEPTASLDLHGRASVRAALEQLRTAGSAVVVVTHDLGLATVADRFAVLGRGVLSTSDGPVGVAELTLALEAGR